MIDIHSHILWGVDDGPETLEDTLSLLREAISEGITDLISTSHAYHPMYHVSVEKIEDQLSTLKTELVDRGMNINIYTGQELRLKDESLKDLCKGRALSLANSRYVLLELPSQTIPAFTSAAIQEIISKGLIPVIAHPERNRVIAEDPNRLRDLILQGAVAQVTAGSLSGHFGRSVQKLSLQLVQANLVQLYGSDVHNSQTRPFEYNRGFEYLESQGLLDSVDILLENNFRVLADESLLLYEPEEVNKSKWWNVLSLSR